MPLDRPIPAFYCCYLLCSTVRRSSVYVGSTPNPVRRLGQHNGHAKGGANRTARPSLRPWEMTCIVTGFPSQIAALQFEWAWQNSHISQHIPAESRLHRSSPRKKNGQPKRPRHGVNSLLSNLHLLLRVPSFSRWPLEIRFFSEDVYKAWQEWSRAVAEPLRSSIAITKDFPPAGALIEDESVVAPQTKRRKLDYGIDALELGYADHKAHVEKGKEILEFELEGRCTLCEQDLEHDAGIYAVCPNTECDSVTHLTCLGNHFIEDADSVIPIKGNCPSCKTELRWVDVVKEVTLRLRGQKEVEKLLKVKRARKGITSSRAALETFDNDDDDDELSEEEVLRDIEEDLEMLKKFDPTGTRADQDETWHDVDDSDDSDTRSIASTATSLAVTVKAAAKGKNKAGTLRTVVEDSDWDDAIFVD